MALWYADLLSHVYSYPGPYTAYMGVVGCTRQFTLITLGYLWFLFLIVVIVLFLLLLPHLFSSFSFYFILPSLFLWLYSLLYTSKHIPLWFRSHFPPGVLKTLNFSTLNIMISKQKSFTCSTEKSQSFIFSLYWEIVSL